MFENLTGDVGMANHQARLTQAREPGRTTRVLDAASRPKRQHTWRYREAMAKALFALAARIAPPMQEQATRTTPAAATH